MGFSPVMGVVPFIFLEPRPMRWKKLVSLFGNVATLQRSLPQVSYPLEYIPNVKIPAVGGHPKNIIMLYGGPAG